jgi:signal transduction histidine kinase
MDSNTTAIDTLNESAWSKRNAEIDTTLEEAQAAYALAEPANYVRGIAESLRSQAEALRQLERSREALPLAQRALKLFEQIKDDHNRLNVTITLSAIYDRLGNVPLALQHALEGRRIARRLNDPVLDGKLYNMLGFIYDEMGDYAQAVSHFQQALDRLRGGVDQALMGKVLNNLAWSHFEQGRYAEALPLVEQGYQLLVETNAVLDQPAVLHTIGAIYQAKGNQRRALEYYNQALEHGQIANDHETAISCLTDISRLHRANGEAQPALDYLARALKLAEDAASAVNLPIIHEEYAEVYESMGDYRAALKHHRLFHQHHIALFNERSDQRMQDLEVMHEVETARLESLAQFQKNQALRKEIEQNEHMITDLESYAHIVAHDLKNPIGLLQMYAYLLQTDLEGKIDPAHMQSIKAIFDTTEEMLHIVEGLLTLAQTRKEQVLAQPLDMNEVVREAIKRLSDKIERSGAELVIPADLPPAQGHASWIEGVWVNYLSNAIKYGGQPPHVELTAQALPTGFIRYAILDNGEGISPERRKVLFQKFERLGKRTTEGHGLGLSIIKTIVEKLGGEVGVDDRPDGQPGSCFSFTLPMQPQLVAEKTA